MEVSDDLPDQGLYRPEKGEPKCPKKRSRRKLLLVDLCVTDAKSSNGSTVWVESVCLNPSLLWWCRGSTRSGSSCPTCMEPCVPHLGCVCGYGHFLKRQGIPASLSDVLSPTGVK